MSVKRTPVQSIVLYRDGKTFIPPVDKVFEFTAEEVADIERVNPGAFSTQATVNVDDVKHSVVMSKPAADPAVNYTPPVSTSPARTFGGKDEGPL